MLLWYILVIGFGGLVEFPFMTCSYLIFVCPHPMTIQHCLFFPSLFHFRTVHHEICNHSCKILTNRRMKPPVQEQTLFHVYNGMAYYHFKCLFVRHLDIDIVCRERSTLTSVLANTFILAEKNFIVSLHVVPTPSWYEQVLSGWLNDWMYLVWFMQQTGHRLARPFVNMNNPF